MLRKLRRTNKDPGVDNAAESQEIVAATPATMPTTTAPDEPPPYQEQDQPPRRVTFFDLPGEIRNTIYELLISTTTLSLPSSMLIAPRKRRLHFPSKRRKAAAQPNPSVNGLLLASHQCRSEYLSFLFSTTTVAIEIHDFDFDNLLRVLRSLAGTYELEALRENRTLTILLMTRNCTPKNLSLLRRWLEQGHEESIALPWKYCFPVEKFLPPTAIGKVRLLRELEFYADMVAVSNRDLQGKQRAELAEVVEAFEVEARKLDGQVAWLGRVSKRSPSHLKGLAGGGVM